ncbi:ATP-binding protein [Pseudolysinimonas sp.]|uniref:ATP-binding protein n=1 Tax=Pseudolysinimonas sp. TaxID=2680009 RepID=UPI003F7FB47A
MRIRVLGGFSVEHDGEPVEVTGAMQRGLLFRLALDAGAQVGYRALAEDLWPQDPPENTRAALQNLVSRLRAQLPAGTLASGPGGYRVTVARTDVDAVRFQDLVAAAVAAPVSEAPALATAALDLWAGEPWTPGEGYDWFERDLAADRATALRLRGAAAPPREPAPPQPGAAVVPVALTAFVGRDEELAALAGQLERGRLVTVLGPGGAGKTRLALEAARGHRHPVVVELAPAGPDELWQAVLGAIGRDMRIAVESGPNLATPLERAAAALAGRAGLGVLDNCEHLIAAAALAAHELLAALPRLRIVATSREPLGLPGEAFVPLGPLDPDAAATLFGDRVLAARGRPLDPDEADPARRIRERLDGLPLALELAAAKARTMSIPEIADGLAHRFDLLSGSLRTVLPRHQTLRALIDWSWSLLEPGERRMLMALAIHPAGVAAADAIAVARAHGGRPEEIDALVDKSLLQRSGGRYRALETIREYGIERLAEEGDPAAERLIQARRLGEAAEARDAQLRSPAIHEAIAWFDAEDDNLAAALRFCADAGHDDELVALAGDCAWYWVIRDRGDDARQWLAVAAPRVGERTGWQALFLRAASLMWESFVDRERPTMPAIDRGDIDELLRLAERSEHDVVRAMPHVIRAFADAMASPTWMRDVQLPDPETLDLSDWGRAILTVARAAIAQNRGDFADHGAASGRAVELFSASGDRWGLALAQQMRAEWLLLAGRFEEALAMSDEATEGMRMVTSSYDLLQLQGLGVNLLLRLGRVDEARERAESMVQKAREVDSARAVVVACAVGASLAVELDEVEWARGLVAELEASLAEWEDVPPQVRAMAATARGGLLALEGDPEAAERELRAAAEAAAASYDFPVMAATAMAVGGFAARVGRVAEAATALEIATALRGAPDPRNPTEIRIRALLDAAARPAGSDPAARAAIDRDAAASALTQILRR